MFPEIQFVFVHAFLLEHLPTEISLQALNKFNKGGIKLFPADSWNEKE